VKIGDVVQIPNGRAGEIVQVLEGVRGQSIYRVRVVGTSTTHSYFESELQVLGENLKGEVKKGAKREDR
jgi:hypothetical protein